jgi:hypothetical protein
MLNIVNIPDITAVLIYATKKVKLPMFCNMGYVKVRIVLEDHDAFRLKG